MQEIVKQLLNGNIVFGIFCFLTLSGAIYVLVAKKIFEASLGLLISFLGVAGVMVLAGAEFVAAAQIMIYIGGILVLLIFGIMLSDRNSEENQSNAEKLRQMFVFALISVALFLLIINLNFQKQTHQNVASIKGLGVNILTDYILILELVGMLLLMALIGATFITKKNE